MRRIVALLGCALTTAVAPEPGAAQDQCRRGSLTSTVTGAIVEIAGARVWRETQTLRNISEVDCRNVTVTSQPYTGAGKGRWDPAVNEYVGGSTERQERTGVDIPAGGTATITFDFTGDEAQRWETWYVDVYPPDDFSALSRIFGGISPYSFPVVDPRNPSDFRQEITYPLPQALATSGRTSGEFYVDFLDSSLPNGWEVDLRPFLFDIVLNDYTTVEAVFMPPARVIAGDTAFVEFDLTALSVPDEWNDRWHARLGVVVGSSVVPEPGSLVLLGTGLAGLAVWRRRRRRGEPV